MPKETTYWPVFLFNAGIIGEFKLIGIFTSESEANTFADKVNYGVPPEKPKAQVAWQTLEGIESHIIQYWMRASFPEHLITDAAKKLFSGDGAFPAAVVKNEEVAA